jgi:hypothetical protein
LSFKRTDKLKLQSYINTHWYSNDVFDVYIENQSKINFLYTPSCLISFDIRYHKNTYQLFFNGLIDCNLHNCFFDKKLIKNKIFASITLCNDTTIKLKYYNLEYIKNIKKNFKKEIFFPEYLKLKKR